MANLYYIEVTDTFGGEANYSWVRRHAYRTEKELSDLQIVRHAKAWSGLTGQNCRRNEYNDTIELRPYGDCIVLFISWHCE